MVGGVGDVCGTNDDHAPNLSSRVGQASFEPRREIEQFNIAAALAGQHQADGLSIRKTAGQCHAWEVEHELL